VAHSIEARQDNNNESVVSS